MLDVYGNPLYPQVMGGSNYSIANDFQLLGQPDKTRPLGDHKGGGTNPALGVVNRKEAEDSSAARFEGEYEEYGETAPDIPWIYSASVLTNPENPPGVQPSTTKATKLDLEGEGMGNLAETVDLVDLDAKIVDGKVVEASELQGGEEGSPRFDFLSTKWKEAS